MDSPFLTFVLVNAVPLPSFVQVVPFADENTFHYELPYLGQKPKNNINWMITQLKFHYIKHDQISQ